MLIGSSIAAAVFAATGQNFIMTFTAATIPTAIALAWMLSNFREELFGQRPAEADEAPPSAAAVTDSQASPTSSLDGGQPDAPPAAGASVSLLQKVRILVTAFQPAYWQALAVVAVLYFARFDAAFLSLRAKQVSR